MYFCYFLSGIIFNYWWVIPSHNVNIDIDYFYKWITWNCHLNYRDWKIIWNTRLEIEKGINKKGEKKRLKGAHGFEPWTYRSAVDCSTTELYPRTCWKVLSMLFLNRPRTLGMTLHCTFVHLLLLRFSTRICFWLSQHLNQHIFNLSKYVTNI